jgi:dihydrofolate reductase
MRKLIAIAAMDLNNCIGRDNKLPWKLRSDLERFKEVTLGSTVIMGRKTFESIGRPLPHRTNVVLTRDPNFTAEGVCVVTDYRDLLEPGALSGDTYIIGGTSIYNLFMPHVDELDLTVVHTMVEGGDAYFPQVDLGEFRVRAFTPVTQGLKDDHPMHTCIYKRLSEEDKKELEDDCE